MRPMLAAGMACTLLVVGAASSCGARTVTSLDASMRDAGTDAPTAQDLVVAACLGYVGCGITLDREAMSACVLGAVTDQSCIVTAGANCNAVNTCLNAGDPNWHCEASTGQSCRGSLALFCDSTGVQFAADCSAFGATCDPAVGDCTLGPCDPSMPLLCVGDQLRECQPTGHDGGYSGLWYECAADAGLACNPDAAATTGECIGRGPACPADRCDGTKLVRCLGGRQAPAVDCAAQGLACVGAKTEAGAASYGASYCGLGTECDSYFNDRCAGNALTFCNLGKITTVDCVKAGWAKCRPATGPVPTGASSGARCSP